MATRDRLLAAVFALQLTVAAVLGGYLVHALRTHPAATLTSWACPAGPAGQVGPAAPGASPTAPGGDAGQRPDHDHDDHRR